MRRRTQESNTSSAFRARDGTSALRAAARFGYCPLAAALIIAETRPATWSSGVTPVLACCAAKVASMPPYMIANPLTGGHRLRLQVSGGAHPRFARHTGTAEPLATAARLVPTDVVVYHDAARPSALVVPSAE